MTVDHRGGMDRLVSKIVAGGLSAGVFLFWWPDHVSGEGLMQLVLRGLLWTLTFELLLLTLGPAEALVQRRISARAVARGERVRSRLSGVPAPARTGGVVALACCGLAAPLALIADAPKQLSAKDERPRVVKQVIVERPVVEKKVVVRKVVAPAAAPEPLQSAGAAPSVPGAQVTRPAARKAAKVAPERVTAERRSAAVTAKTAPAQPTAKTAPAADATATPAPAPATATATAPATPAPAPAPAG